MKYNFYVEYETGTQNRKECAIIAENALEAISIIIEQQKNHHLYEWEKNPLGMISVKARIPIDE